MAVLVGPAIDLSLFGTPSLIGHGEGKKKGFREGAISRKENPERLKFKNYAGLLTIPGSIGYHLGYMSGWRRAQTLKKDKSS